MYPVSRPDAQRRVPAACAHCVADGAHSHAGDAVVVANQLLGWLFDRPKSVPFVAVVVVISKQCIAMVVIYSSVEVAVVIVCGVAVAVPSSS